MINAFKQFSGLTLIAVLAVSMPLQAWGSRQTSIVPLDQQSQLRDFDFDNLRSNSNSKKPKKLDQPLTDLYQKSLKGRVATQDFVQKRAIERVSSNTVTVFLISEPGKSANTINKGALTANGVKVIKSAGNIIKADVPIDRLKAVAETVEGISMVRLPQDPELLSVQSEGVNLTGADTYHAAGFSGIGVKTAVIDTGFASLSSAKQVVIFLPMQSA